MNTCVLEYNMYEYTINMQEHLCMYMYNVTCYLCKFDIAGLQVQ